MYAKELNQTVYPTKTAVTKATRTLAMEFRRVRYQSTRALGEKASNQLNTVEPNPVFVSPSSPSVHWDLTFSIVNVNVSLWWTMAVSRMTVPGWVIGGAFLAFLFLFIVQIVISAFYKPTSEDKFIIILFTLLPGCVFLFSLYFQFFALWTCLKFKLLSKELKNQLHSSFRVPSLLQVYLKLIMNL